MDFQKASSLEPLAPAPKYGLGLTALHEGQSSRALKMFDLAIELQRIHGTTRNESPYAAYLFSPSEEVLRSIRSRLKVSAERPQKKLVSKIVKLFLDIL